MDERIIIKKLQILQGLAAEQSLCVSPWEARTALHQGPEQYEYLEDWHKVPDTSRWPAGVTVFLRAKAQVPPDWDPDCAFLRFGIDDLEGLLTLNGKPWAGVDRQHGRCPVPVGQGLDLLLEFDSVPRVRCEPGLSGKTSSFSGAHLVHDVGYLASGMTASYEQMVICNELIHWVKRFVQPVEISDETLALDLIAENGADGQYLNTPHTGAHFRQDWYSRLFDRQNIADWEKAGSTTLRQRAVAQARKLLARHQPEPLPAGVPDRDSEHPVQRPYAVDALLLVLTQDHLGVGLGPKGVTASPQSLAKLTVVVDLTVVHQHHAAVVAHHRLMPARREVDDRQSPLAQHDIAVGGRPQAPVVGPAVGEGGLHPLQGIARDSSAAKVNDSGNAAHVGPYVRDVRRERKLAGLGRRSRLWAWVAWTNLLARGRRGWDTS